MRERHLLRIGTLGVFLLLLSTSGIQCGIGQEELQQKVDEMAEAILGCRDIVGINLAVVHGNDTLISKGYGLMNTETKTPVNEKSIFSIASLSKAFAVTLLAIVLEEHETYNWDTTVREVLGDDFYFHDATRTKMVTLRDLGSHKTGLAPRNYVRFQGPTRKELAHLVQYMEPIDQFRASYLYNNLMYGLISYVSEVIGGKSWEDLMTEKIFKPLGMTSSTFSHVTDLEREDLAQSYLKYNETWRPVSAIFHREWGELGGSGSVLTNAEDMVFWLKFHLNKGKNTKGDQVLSAKGLQETYTAYNIIPDSSGSLMWERPNAPVSYVVNNYGMGWRAGKYRGLPLTTHTGTSWGYGGLLTLLPTEGIGIYSSITGSDGQYMGRKMLHMLVADLLMGEKPWMNLTTACSFPEPWMPPLKKTPFRPILEFESSRALSEYEGTFGNFLFGNLVIKQNGTKLEMSIGKIGRWRLTPSEKADDFVGEGHEVIWPVFLSQVTFFSSKNNDKIDSLKIPRFERKDPPVFVKGLKMSDAPDPPNLKCDSTASSSCIFNKPSLLIIVFMMYITSKMKDLE